MLITRLAFSPGQDKICYNETLSCWWWQCSLYILCECVFVCVHMSAYTYIYSHHNVWLNKCVCISWSACSADTHTCSMRVCVHLWHALRRPSADSGLWRTTKLALLSTAVKTSIREQRHSWLVSESLSFALCSQAKWLERFNQQRHWKDSYLPAFHLAHSSSLTAALAFPSSTTYLRDRHFPSKDKYGKRHKETETFRRRPRKRDVRWYEQHLSTERIIVLADRRAIHRCGFTAPQLATLCAFLCMCWCIYAHSFMCVSKCVSELESEWEKMTAYVSGDKKEVADFFALILFFCSLI